VSLAILQRFEADMLAMGFEVLLTQIVNFPTKYLIKEYPGGEDEERKAVETFDREFKGVKIPTMLLERLKREFDENYEVSKRSGSVSGTNSVSSGGEEKPQTASTPKASGGFRSLFSSSKKD